MDRVSSSDARGLYPETLEVLIRGQVQLRILELGDETGEEQKKSSLNSFILMGNQAKPRSHRTLSTTSVGPCIICQV